MTSGTTPKKPATRSVLSGRIATGKPSQEFDRFQVLTKALVKVPKKEIDAARERKSKKK